MPIFNYQIFKLPVSGGGAVKAGQAQTRVVVLFGVELGGGGGGRLVGLEDLLGEAAPQQAVAAVAPLDRGVERGLDEQVGADALAVQPRDQVLEFGEGQAAVLQKGRAVREMRNVFLEVHVVRQRKVIVNLNFYRQ